MPLTQRRRVLDNAPDGYVRRRQPVDRDPPQPAPELGYSLVPGSGSSTTTAVSVGRRDA